MDLPSLLEELANRFHLPDLKLNKDGVARLVFDKKLVVDIESPEDSDKFFIIGTIAPSPSAGRESLYGKLLEANSFGRATGGGVLGLDPVAFEIILTRGFPLASIEFEAFAAALEQFLNAMEHWQQEVHNHPATPAAEPTPHHHHHVHHHHMGHLKA